MQLDVQLPNHTRRVDCRRRVLSVVTQFKQFVGHDVACDVMTQYRIYLRFHFAVKNGIFVN